MDTTNKLSEEAERARFEAYLTGEWPTRAPFQRDYRGDYFDPLAHKGWAVWLAAKSDAAQATQPVSDLNQVATQPAEAVAWMQSKPFQQECVPCAEYLTMTDAWKRHLLNSGDQFSIEFANSHDVPLVRAHPAPASASEPATCQHCRRDDCKDFDANGCSNSAG